MSSNRQVKKSIAKRSARALVLLCQEQSSHDEAERFVDAINEVFEGSPEFAHIAENPTVSRSDLKAVLLSIAEKLNADSNLKEFCAVVAKHRRVSLFPEIRDEYKKLCAEMRGEVSATVISKQALTDQQVTSIADSLGKTLGKKVAIKNELDASIMGGLIVKVGSLMLDDSVKAKLEALRLVSKRAVAAL